MSCIEGHAAARLCDASNDRGERPAAPRRAVPSDGHAALHALVGDTRWAEIRLDMSFERPSGFDGHLGALWHGLLGLGLRRSGCLRPGGCGQERCAEPGVCLYGRIMEPPGRPASGLLAATTPSPVILRCAAQSGPPGEHHRLRIGVWGALVDRAAEIAAALVAGAGDGVGPRRARARVESVTLGPAAAESDGVPAPLRISDWIARQADRRVPVCERATAGGSAAWDLDVELLAPLRLKRRGRPTAEPSYRDILAGILRRASLMSFHHGEGNPAAAQWRPPEGLLDEAAAVRMAADLRWTDGDRYSARQERSHPMGGLEGRIHLKGLPGRHLPWLFLAEILGVGHGVSLGLGHVRMGSIAEVAVPTP